MSIGYWRETLMIAFDEADCYEVLKSIGDEKIEAISESLNISAGMEGECTGRYNIPDPRDNEVDKLKKKIKELEETISKNGLLYSNKISDILKINREDLSIGIDRDEVKVDWRLQ